MGSLVARDETTILLRADSLCIRLALRCNVTLVTLQLRVQAIRRIQSPKVDTVSPSVAATPYESAGTHLAKTSKAWRGGD